MSERAGRVWALVALVPLTGLWLYGLFVLGLGAFWSGAELFGEAPGAERRTDRALLWTATGCWAAGLPLLGAGLWVGVARSWRAGVPLLAAGALLVAVAVGCALASR